MLTEAQIDRLRERAAELGVSAHDDESLIEAVLAHDVSVPPPSEDECRRAYDRDPGRYSAQTLVEADHILFALTPSTPIDLLRERAEAVLHEVRRDPESFAGRARELSNCPSGAVGGSLGQLTQDDCVAEFWHALVAHGKPGIVPTLVHTRYGLHIVRIARIVPGEALPFDAVRSRIADDLSRRAFVHALKLYGEDLARAA